MIMVQNAVTSRHARSALSTALTHLGHAAHLAAERAHAHPLLAARMRWARRVLASTVENAPRSNSPCANGGVR